MPVNVSKLLASALLFHLAGSGLFPVVAQDATHALLRRRAEAVARAYKEAFDLYREGRTRDVDRIYRWSERWFKAEEDLSDKKADRIAAADHHWQRMKRLEDLVRGSYKAGAAAAIELPAVEYYRLDAEIALARAKAH
jgi:hypothetical protein